jgi:hypothetical protein
MTSIESSGTLAASSRRQQLWIIVLLVVTLTALASHALMAWLKIETTFGRHWVVDAQRIGPSMFVAGSSLAGDGLFWPRITEALGRRAEGWGVAGSSPPEWEAFQPLATESDMTVLVVSAYDLNEHYLSDFRADIVPLQQTVRDLWRSGADWPYAKRLLGAYPLHFIRMLYPTAGRSEGVIVGVREAAANLAQGVVDGKEEPAPTLAFGADETHSYKTEKITDWSPGRMLRRLTEMRSAGQGKHGYEGPKKLAFLRMLQRAHTQGEVIVVVLPVSPQYTSEFLTARVQTEFEAALEDARRSAPGARWVRLDRAPELHSNEYFWDLVHMNSPGQQISTNLFLAHLRESK